MFQFSDTSLVTVVHEMLHALGEVKRAKKHVKLYCEFAFLRDLPTFWWDPFRLI